VPAALIVDRCQVVELIVAARAEEEIGQVVGLPVKDIGGLTCGAAELAGIGVRTELWMEIRDSDPTLMLLRPLM